MSYQKFIAPLVALAFAVAPISARASTPIESHAPAAVKTVVVEQQQQTPAAATEVEDLAAREQQAQHLEKYQGGEPVVIVSGAVLGTVLVVVLVIVLIRALGSSGDGGGKTVIVND